MKAWDYLQDLMQVPPRGSGTRAEKEAAHWLHGRLTELGYATTMQSFKSPRYTLYAGPAIVNGVLLLALLLSPRWPLVMAFAALLVLLPLVGELMGNRLNFNLLLPKVRSQNVVATAARQEQRTAQEQPTAAEANEAQQHIVVVAHYDTQWGSWLFAPAFRPFLKPFFIATYAGVIFGAGALLWRALVGTGPPGFVVATATGLLLATTVFLVGALITGRAVPGANDNGSGVAVALALAHRWRNDGVPGVNVSFLFTGCEEVGLRGMHHYLRATPPPPGTMFVNLDNVGGGRLRYLLGEGMVGYVPYDAHMVETARRLATQSSEAVEPLRNLLLPTDALLPAKAGYPAITFIAAGDNDAIPNYHWHTDTLANADRRVVEQTEHFVWAFIKALTAGSRAADS